MYLYAAGGLGLALIAIPLYLEKTPPKFFYGFRIGKALDTPETW
jgi:hypothetical protein